MLAAPCRAVIVQSADLDALIAEAKRRFPHECCGILVGRSNAENELVVTRALPAQNVAASRLESRYEIDPRALLQIETELRGHPDEFVAGFFHSHPRGANVPSPIDLADARGVFEFARRFYVYAIVSLQGEGNVRWWSLTPQLDGFEELPAR
jgi:proteasome lid subunit RPN8/RPN11